ncbi:hypothetical protein [Microbulbifer taiwanensis]|uniref:Saccharopine dehydrogenase n=1 Tax=Microbulbifer taiwanensis TaxID=986746 RepID=A0ABW1YIF6_9GAMM|nr:hypothetical protein [Microbulbifer taiwanensis]
MNPVLFVGGTGVVGRQAVKLFRERHPEVPILIGGRDLVKSEDLASKVGNASPVEVDTSKALLGIEKDTSLGAVVMMTPDEGLNGMSLAQDKGIPYLSIGNWLVEVGAEMAHFIRHPQAAPVVLASHWHGGPAVFLAQIAARKMETVHTVLVSAIVDDKDETGPVAIEDMERGAAGGAGVWAFRDGRRVWLAGNEASRIIETLDGRRLKGDAFSPYDVVSLHAATGARDVRFDLASTVSSSRARGGEIATELVVQVEGTSQGKPCLQRATLEFDRGQAMLTGLSTILTLSTALGLEGHLPVPPGLYFPEMILDAEWYLCELVRAGANVDLDRS